MPKNPAKYETYPVPANNEPIYIVDKDKEIASPVIMVNFKQDVIPAELRGTMMLLVQKYINNVISSALNTRLNELSQ